MKINNPGIIQEILKRGKLKSMLESHGIGSTGEAHRAKLDGKKYLLRICKDAKTARKYKLYYDKLKKYKIFPKLLELKGKYVLFEFIEGRRGKEKEEPQVIYQIGKICALINQIKAKHSKQKALSFLEKLKEIYDKRIISKELYKKILQEYNGLNKTVKFNISYDAGDVTNDNFIIDPKGRAYFVDIEAIRPTKKGMGIAKAFAAWFKKEKQRAIFKKGYESIASMKFYTKDYGRLLTLIFYTTRIRFKHNKGEHEIVKRTIYKLEKLLDDK